MSLESSESWRLTRFPGKEERRGHLLQSLTDTEDNTLDGKRKTRFPGKPNQQSKHVPVASLNGPSQAAPGRKESTPIASRIPISVNGNSAINQLLPVKTIERVQPTLESAIQDKNPWLTYKPLRNISQRSQIGVACTRFIPIRIVTLKEVSVAIQLDNMIKFRHQNLVEFIEACKYQNKLIVISEFIQVSLSQAIAIPYDFEEVHVSAVCSQVFDGMQYLLTQGFSHKGLDSSRVLLASNGCVKIAYIGHCQQRGSTSARALGLLALEMMQKGVIQKEIKDSGDLVLKSPETWSIEARKFLEITSSCSLNDIKTNGFLQSLSVTIMLPFVCYTQLETIAPIVRKI